LSHYSLFASPPFSSVFFFYHHPATPEIYTLSLHDALPIFSANRRFLRGVTFSGAYTFAGGTSNGTFQQLPSILARSRNTLEKSRDRKSTRLNSSHVAISYAVFCLKKKKNIIYNKI